MAIGQDVRTFLLSKSSFTSVVGTRLYAGTLPQRVTTAPFVIYSIVSQNAAHHLGNGAGFAETRIQFDVYAITPEARDSLVEIIRNILQGYSGTMGSSTVSSVTYKNSIDQYVQPQDQSDIGNWRNTTDYWFRHDQAVPTHA